MNTNERPFKQGDIFWIKDSHSSEVIGEYSHPHVIVQEDVLNQSRVRTVVMCALTSNMKRSNEPGNVLLNVGEANLQRHSIVVVSQVETVKKSDLEKYVGTLNQRRVEQIFSGMKFQHKSFFERQKDL